MRHVAAASGTLLALVLVLSGCGQDEESVVAAEDAYKVGCPAVDSGVAAGSVTRRVSAETLRQVRDKGGLSADARKWLDASIRLLEASKPEDLPAEMKQVVVDGCAENGQALRNLSAS